MRKIVVAIAALLVTAGFATNATAGTYQVLACSQIASGANNSWEAFNSDPAHLSTGQVCPPTDGSGEASKSTGMFATDTLGSSGGVSDGAIAGWRFIAPPGTEIVGFQDDRYLGAYGDNGWVPFVKADGTVLETCTFTVAEERCSVGSPSGSGSLDGLLTVDEASTLTVGIECSAAGGCTTGTTLHRAWAALYGAKVTLSTQAPPSIANPTGSLWESGAANGFHKGTQQVNVSASDLTGIAKVAISVDGHVVASQEGICDYSRPLPCKPLNATFVVDTTKLVDGTHTVVIEAYDAAGNEGRLTEQIVVGNQPPPPPTNLTTVEQSDGSFIVSWSDPADVTPIVGAVYETCPLNGNGCSNPVETGHDSPFSLPASDAGQVVKVWLIDAAGNSNPANAAAQTLSAPKSKSLVITPVEHLPALRLRHAVHGHRLSLVALVPSGVPGPIQFKINVNRGRTYIERMSRQAKVKRGQAKVVFFLSSAVLHASHLSITVGAKGATPTSVSLVLKRRSPRRTHG
jgi:hypothetical protein